MAERFENNILGLVPQRDWLDVGFNVNRPNDPIDGLFGDERTDNLIAYWESIAAEYQIPVMAKFHAFDTEAEQTFRIPIDNHSIEKGLIKVKINQTERMDALIGSGVQDSQLYDYVIRDGVRLAEQVFTRSKVGDAYIPNYPPMDRYDDQIMRHYPPYGGEYGGNVTDMREYGRRYRPPRDKMGSRREESRGGMEGREPMIGFGESYEEGQGKHLTEEEAKRWVKSMRKEDGSKGGWWSLDEIKQYARNFGIEGKEKIVEFFAVINAMYSDYCKVVKQHGVDNVNFYADMAKAFMDNPDGKVKMYYECIAKKG